jgi:hypothetical protein
MPDNSCGPGRAGGRSGTTAGTAPRPEGRSRARRWRTGAGMTGSGGRGFCASQRRAASTRATLLPPLGMSLSVVSGMSDRMSAVADPGVRRGRRWPAWTERTRVSCENAKPALPWLGTASLASTRALVTPCHAACGRGRSGAMRIPPFDRGRGVYLSVPVRLEHHWITKLSGTGLVLLDLQGGKSASSPPSLPGPLRPVRRHMDPGKPRAEKSSACGGS